MTQIDGDKWHVRGDRVFPDGVSLTIRCNYMSEDAYTFSLENKADLKNTHGLKESSKSVVVACFVGSQRCCCLCECGEEHSTGKPLQVMFVFNVWNISATCISAITSSTTKTHLYCISPFLSRSHSRLFNNASSFLSLPYTHQLNQPI